MTPIFWPVQKEDVIYWNIKTWGRRRSERVLREFVLNMLSWGCPSDIQEAVPVGSCIYGLDCRERSGIEIYIGVTLSAWWWSLWHQVESPMWWLSLKKRRIPTRKGVSRKECDGKANGTEEKSGEHVNKEINKCCKEGKGCFKETVKKSCWKVRVAFLNSIIYYWTKWDEYLEQCLRVL